MQQILYNPLRLSWPRLSCRWRSIARWLLVLLAVYQIVLAGAVWWQGTRDDRRPADAILVLGAAQWDGEPSPILRARVDHALALYRQGYAPRLMLTGGVGEGDRYSEAAVAAHYLADRGVPPQAILVEEQGRSSRESIHAAADILSGAGLSRVVLVSDPPHMLRILRMAQSAGLEAYGSAAQASPAVGSPAAQAMFVLREVLLCQLQAG
jgi:uncharacterized SAM-binding protein YcdF (DUF218 family)